VSGNSGPKVTSFGDKAKERADHMKGDTAGSQPFHPAEEVHN
jgi:hypothetical protein